MASEDVLERVEAMRQADQFRWTTYRRDLVEMIEALAAEVRELRELLVGALDIIHTPYYDMMAKQIQFQERIEAKVKEIQSAKILI